MPFPPTTSELRIWWCSDHEGHYPVGVASIVVAETEQQARELLFAKLAEHGLTQRQKFTLLPLTLDRAKAIVINDGDY